MSRATVDVRELLRRTTNTQTIRDIQAALSHAWRGTIVHLAVLDMCRHGELELEDDLTVQVLALAAD